MVKAIVFGNENLAVMTKDYLQLRGTQVSAFTVDDQFVKESDIDGLPVIPFSEFVKSYSVYDAEVYVAVGYKKMGKVREEILNRIWSLGYKTPNFIDDSVLLGPNVQLGKANIILQGVSIGYKVSIGNGNLIFDRATITHNSTLGDFNTLSIESSICGNTKISNHCFCGANSVIRDNLCISDYTLAGAGSYICINTEPYQAFASPRSVLLGKRSIDVEEMK